MLGCRRFLQLIFPCVLFDTTLAVRPGAGAELSVRWFAEQPPPCAGYGVPRGPGRARVPSHGRVSELESDDGGRSGDGGTGSASGWF